ncbi:MAG TPA: glutamate--tRNA ligase [Tepidisphaeraceae bacterium]|nr:glutamate--tRNA ligase [Tepidisphaeraceae bacterium]
MSDSKQVVTRFAPSPTGYLHVGGARTALFNWLLARHTGGRYLLRIEDTDLARSTDDAVRQLVEDLRWLGLNWDNPELVYQSKRLAIYNRIIDDLLARGLAYEAWETSEELDQMRQAAQRSKRPFIYRKPTYSADQLKKFADEGRKPVVRFVMPVKEYRFFDVTLGKEIAQPAHESQDFVIRKTDGMPTYHFGVVVDDADMGCTHVLRGLEHLKNTFNHIALQDALGYERPTYAHLSVMLNPENGEKLSKRDRDRRIRKRVQEVMRSSKKPAAELASASGLSEQRFTDWLNTDTMQLDLTEQPKVMKAVGLKESDLPEIMVHDFRKNGYVPEVLLNFLALQGWSPGGDKEQMSIEEMVQLFSLDRVLSSNPKFNREKLKAFSTDYFAKAPMDRQVRALRDYLSVNPMSSLNRATDEQLAVVLKMNEGYRILSEVDEKSRFLFTHDDQIEYDPQAVEKVLVKNDRQGATALREVRDVLAGAAEWAAHPLESAVTAFCEQKQLGLGKVAQPIRVAVSGSAVSPPIFEAIALLGRDATLRRIDRCLASLG